MVKFSSPPNPLDYKQQVWDLVRMIPVGKVATYGQIASFIPIPDGVDLAEYRTFGPRWVGGAMSACPDDVPWQRVINSQGKISLPSHGAGRVQHQLLETEGVVFNDRDCIDLAIFRWLGPEVQNNFTSKGQNELNG